MIENILSRLSKVKGRNGAYVACCPAHNDKSPSLAIREVEDGRILLKCFGGCSVQEIVGSIGMDIGELFPPDDKLSHHKPRVKNAFYATDLLRVIEFESVLVSVAASNVANGVKLTDNDRSRLRQAQERIIEAARHIR